MMPGMILKQRALLSRACGLARHFVSVARELKWHLAYFNQICLLLDQITQVHFKSKKCFPSLPGYCNFLLQSGNYTRFLQINPFIQLAIKMTALEIPALNTYNCISVLKYVYP